MFAGPAFHNNLLSITYSFFQIPPRGGHPCCSAIHFPLPGRVRDFHPLERAHGAHTKSRPADFIQQGSLVFHFLNLISTFLHFFHFLVLAFFRFSHFSYFRILIPGFSLPDSHYRILIGSALCILTGTVPQCGTRCRPGSGHRRHRKLRSWLSISVSVIPGMLC